MTIISSDGNRSVNIGTSDVWYALYSTIVSCIGNKYALALDLFKTGECKGNIGYETAKEFNHIRDELAQFPPEKAVYNIDKPNIEAPWKGHISPVITSCANFFTTADGGDLLYEIVSILCYAKVSNTDIEIR